MECVTSGIRFIIVLVEWITDNINYDKTNLRHEQCIKMVIKNQQCESGMWAVRPHVINSLVGPLIKSVLPQWATRINPVLKLFYFPRAI